MKNKGPIESDLNKHHAKFEDPLWDEEAAVSKAIRVCLDNKKENIKDYQWNFFENDQFVCSLSGNSLTKQQINFLQTFDGVTFLLTKYKQGDMSIKSVKAELKNVLNNRKRK